MAFPDPSRPSTQGLDCALSDSLLTSQFHTRMAIEAFEDCWTYDELENASRFLSEYLRGLDLPAGRTVCILAARNPGLIVALIGTIAAGMAFVIMDPAYPSERTMQCLALVRPIGLISVNQDADLSGRYEEAIRTYGAGRFILALPGRKAELTKDLRLRAFGSRATKSPTALSPRSLLYIAFTSGSTGFPRGIVGEHAPVTHFLAWQRRRFNLTAEERVTMLSGLGHDPLLRDIFMPLCIGAAICIPPRECFTVPGRLFEWMRKSRITVSHLTPSLATLLLTGMPQYDDAPLESLRLVFFGGEPLTYSLVRRLKARAPNVTIVNCYGSTETPQVAGYHVVSQQETEALSDSTRISATVPVGCGIDDVQLLVQAEDGRLCEVGEQGEIWIRSPYLAREVRYQNGRCRASNKINTHTGDPADSIYPTGDWGIYLPDGAVAFIGRKDKQIKIRGHRVQLEEIERLLASEPDLLSYHIDVGLDKGLQPFLTVYLIPQPHREMDTRSLKRKLAEQLPDYMVPGRLTTVREFPLTPNGKVDTQTLRSAVSPSIPALAGTQPTDVNSRVLRLCANELAAPSLGIDDSLVDSGLNSLQSITLCSAIEEQFKVRISGQDLVECDTPRRLANRINVHAARQKNPMPAMGMDGHRVSHKVGSRLIDPPTPLPLYEGSRPRLLPRYENVWTGVKNRLLQIFARIAPDPVRVKCHRWRRVTIGENVSIGYDTVVETSYPWLVKIGNHVNIGMRVTIIGHFRGMGSREMGIYTVEIDDLAFIGPGVIILPNVKIGRGAVVTAGSVVNSSIPPLVMAHGNPAVPIARCGVPLTGNTTYSEFLRHLQSL